jgi:hypothetical protein
MRPLILAASFSALTLTAAAGAAQSIPTVPGDFPEPGTFCAPFMLCPPQAPVTRDDGL